MEGLCASLENITRLRDELKKLHVLYYGKSGKENDENNAIEDVCDNLITPKLLKWSETTAKHCELKTLANKLFEGSPTSNSSISPSNSDPSEEFEGDSFEEEKEKDSNDLYSIFKEKLRETMCFSSENSSFNLLFEAYENKLKNSIYSKDAHIFLENVRNSTGYPSFKLDNSTDIYGFCLVLSANINGKNREKIEPKSFAEMTVFLSFFWAFFARIN